MIRTHLISGYFLAVVASTLVTFLFGAGVAFAATEPWDNVKTAIGNCGAAAGNGSTDDTATIQCHLNYMNTHYGGGIVYFPPGNYRVSGGGLIVRGGVNLVGEGKTVTSISVASDSGVITFDAATCNSNALKNIAVYGYENAAATTNAVTIGTNCFVILRDDIIWYGHSGLYTRGVDSLIMNTSIFGFHAAVTSQGAEWYVNDTLNTVGGYHSTYGFYKGAPFSGASSYENHFVQTSISGNYTYSVYIDDGISEAFTAFQDSVLSSPIHIETARWTGFVNNKIDSTISGHDGVITQTGIYPYTRVVTLSGSYSNPAPIPSGVATPQVPAGAITTGAWDNVTVAVGNCGAALGNATDMTATIQCHLDRMYNTYGTGVVFFPPGSYRVSGGGLTVRGGVQIIGAGQTVTSISVNSNSEVVTFDAATCTHPSLSDVIVIGYQNSSATANTVVVGENCAVTIRDTRISEGYAGLYTSGIGGVYENNYIYGNNSNVISHGANWYVRDKIDSSLPHSEHGFYQGAPFPGATSAENHFWLNDFSGYFTYSIRIEDPTHSAVSVFDGGVSSQGILINGAKSTIFKDAEIVPGFSAIDGGTLSIVGSYGLSPVTIAVGPGTTLSGSNNFNVDTTTQPPPPPPPPPPPNPATLSISADVTTIASGESTTIRWSSTNTSTCTASDNPHNPTTSFPYTSKTGVLGTGILTQNTTYTLNCTGLDGQAYTKSVTVTVTATTPTATILANNQELLVINPGATYTLSWSSSNVTACSIKWVRIGGETGSLDVDPNAAGSGTSDVVGTHTITCQSPTGPVSKTTTITVAVPPSLPTATISADSTTIHVGESTTINASFTAGANDAITETTINTGDTSVIPYGPETTRTYKFTPTSAGDTKFLAFARTTAFPAWTSYNSVTVHVLPVGAPLPETPTNLVGKCIQGTANGNVEVKVWWDAAQNAEFYHLRINDPSNDGPSCTSNWYCPNTTDVTIDVHDTSYTATLYPNRTYQWWLLSDNSAGQTSGTAAGPALWCPTTPPPPPPPPATLTITADATTIDAGESTTVRWDSTNTSTCTASESPQTTPTSFPHTSKSGVLGTGQLLHNTTYTLNCTGLDGQAYTKSATVTVIPGPTPPPLTPTNLGGRCVQGTPNGNVEVQVGWDPAPNADFYLLRINDPSNDGPSCSGGWYCPNTTDVTMDVHGATSYTATLYPNRTYQWWLLSATGGANPRVSGTAAGPGLWCPAMPSETGGSES